MKIKLSVVPLIEMTNFKTMEYWRDPQGLPTATFISIFVFMMAAAITFILLNR